MKSHGVLVSAAVQARAVKILENRRRMERSSDSERNIPLFDLNTGRAKDQAAIKDG